MKDRNWIDFSIYACIIEVKAEYLGFSHSRKVEHFTRIFYHRAKNNIRQAQCLRMLSADR